MKHKQWMKSRMAVVAAYVHHRRGRFSALATVIVLYPLIKRPYNTWAEFEKDFRMYDEFSKRRK